MTRVLLIDNEASNRLVMQSRLKELGYQVVAAENGAQGLSLAREQAVDLFLVEAGLSGGISACDVCRRLKQIPQTASVPLVLISRQANRDDMTRGYEAGCDAYVTKSESGVLDHVMRVLLHAKGERDELMRNLHSLEEANRRLVEERERSSDLEHTLQAGGEQSVVWREMAAGRPDGLLVVDDEGVVRFADRGAHDLLGSGLEGKNLGRLAPASGLEAFVRDARDEKREGHRFDIPMRNGRCARPMLASVVPIVSSPGEPDPGLRVVILLDASRRRVAAELLRMQEYTLPRKEVGALLDAARMHFTTRGLIGPGPALSQVRNRLVEAAQMLDPVLILGAHGTGRRHVARTLHYGGQWGGPFMAVQCAGFSREHLEVELFGQIKGGLPDAILDRPGAFQHALHGTVYLEDVDQLPPELQSKLLRALTEHVVCRVGTEKPEAVEVRVVASSAEDLRARVGAGTFDGELLRALAAIEIELPPLRERREDIPALALHFLRLYGAGRPDIELSADAVYRLETYDWPGNVRELRACIERACKLATGNVIGVEQLSAALRDLPADPPDLDLTPAPRGRSVSGTHLAGAHNGSLGGGKQDWEIGPDDPIELDLYEKKCLLRAIAEAGGDKLKAARLLGVGKSTLYRKLKKYAIQ